MQAGRLRRRVQLQTATAAVNSYGERIESWATFATVWASVAELPGRELVAGRAELAIASTRIVMRYRADLAPEDRILHGAAVYDVKHVGSDERRTLTEALCVRVVS